MAARAQGERVSGIKGQKGGGGPRRGSGPHRRRLYLDKKTAQQLRVLLLERRGLLNAPMLTEESVVSWLIEQEVSLLDEHIQRSAELALQGERDYSEPQGKGKD